jgi:glycosyltransferase involved in cell wall biosynthesis
MKRLKIAYVSIYDSTDIHKWSGLGYYIAKTLEKHVGDVEYIGNLKTKRFWNYELKRLTNKILFNKQFLYDVTPKVVACYAEEVKERMNGKNFDVIFSPGTIPIAMLETKIPIAFWTDACQPGLVDFYESKNKISDESLKQGVEIEKKSLDNSSLAIYASDWAASIAINYHKINPSKVKVVPWGANLENNYSQADIVNLVRSRKRDLCKLLFVGVDWIRKGGDIALGTASELNKRGIKTELTVVGCDPVISEPLPPFVKPLGFISKSTQEGRTKLNQLFAESHFLIVPSEAEAYGLVFCEANSFGVPALSKKLGGITTIIKDNINGKTFDKNAEIDEYVNFIYNTLNDYNKYKELCLSSFIEFKTRLNWDTAGRTVKKLIEEMLGRK